MVVIGYAMSKPECGGSVTKAYGLPANVSALPIGTATCHEYRDL